MLVSVLGDRHSKLAPGWRTQTVVALAGEVDLDASAGVAPEAVLTCVSLFGDLKLRVPPGTRVTQRGFTLGGDHEVHVSPASDGPQVAVKVFGLLTDVDVTDGSR